MPGEGLLDRAGARSHVTVALGAVEVEQFQPKSMLQRFAAALVDAVHTMMPPEVAQPGRPHLQEPSLVSGATSAGCALW